MNLANIAPRYPKVLPSAFKCDNVVTESANIMGVSKAMGTCLGKLVEDKADKTKYIGTNLSILETVWLKALAISPY